MKMWIATQVVLADDEGILVAQELSLQAVSKPFVRSEYIR